MLLSEVISKFYDEGFGVVSKGTMTKYQATLDEFSAWLGQSQESITLESISRQTIRDFKAYLLDRPKKQRGRRNLSISDGDESEQRYEEGKLSLQTVDKHLRTLRRFFNFCVEEEFLTDSPMKHVGNVRLPKVPPKYMTADDCKRMLSAAYRLPAPALFEARNQAIVALMFSEVDGYKVGSGELSRLKKQHIDGCSLHFETIRDFGRTREYFSLRMNDEQKEALNHWLDVRPNAFTSEFVFTTVDNRGGSGGGEPLQTRPVYSAYFYEQRMTPEDKVRRREDIASQMYYQARRLALLLFFIDTGARIGGVCGLTLDRLDLTERTATVIEKGRGGKKARTVFFSDVTADALANWIRLYGQNKTVFGLSAKKARDNFELLARLAGVEDRVHNPHSLRHAFARSLLLQGVSIGVLSRMMGHSSVVVTLASYGVFADHELKEVYESKSPVGYLLCG